MRYYDHLGRPCGYPAYNASVKLIRAEDESKTVVSQIGLTIMCTNPEYKLDTQIGLLEVKYYPNRRFVQRLIRLSRFVRLEVEIPHDMINANLAKLSLITVGHSNVDGLQGIQKKLLRIHIDNENDELLTKLPADIECLEIFYSGQTVGPDILARFACLRRLRWNPYKHPRQPIRVPASVEYYHTQYLPGTKFAIGTNMRSLIVDILTITTKENISKLPNLKMTSGVKIVEPDS